MKKVDKRKLAAGMITFVCLTAAGAAGTGGYLTGQETVNNIFSVGDLEIDLKESEWEPQQGDGENMCPGYCVYKNPTVKNTSSEETGGNPCYVRLKLCILDKEGMPISEKETLKLIKETIRYDSTYTGAFLEKGEGSALVQGRISGYSLKEIEKLPMVNPMFKEDTKRSSDNMLVFNYEGKDGKGILGIGEEAALFTNIVFPAHWTEKEMAQLGDFRLVIQAEAVQITGFSNRGEAYHTLDEELNEGGIHG